MNRTLIALSAVAAAALIGGIAHFDRSPRGIDIEANPAVQLHDADVVTVITTNDIATADRLSEEDTYTPPSTLKRHAHKKGIDRSLSYYDQLDADVANDVESH